MVMLMRIREFKKNTGIEVLQCSSINLKEDLDGLAALIELCDLVVSTSSVTIHMAGALEKTHGYYYHLLQIFGG